MELENILSEVSQAQKVKDQHYHIHINKYRTCFQKWDCWRRLREEEKKDRMTEHE
jgi:hypothetical protein